MDRLFLLFTAFALTITGCGETNQQSAQTLKSELEEINNNYPAPLLPDNTSLQKVTSVTDDGVIVVENERNIQLEGVGCQNDIATSLRRLFSDERIKVIVKASNSEANPQRSYVWYTFAEFADMAELEEIPAMSINEMLVMTKNCPPATLGSHRYSERYQALYELSRTVK